MARSLHKNPKGCIKNVCFITSFSTEGNLLLVIMQSNTPLSYMLSAQK